MKINKYKGFTLIELLAVIIILSLLALIVGTSVTKIVKSSKNDLYNQQLLAIKEAAESWSVDNLSLLPSDGECKYITLGFLKKYGLLEDNMIDPRTEQKMSDDLKIKIVGSMNKYNSLVMSYEVNPSDINGCTIINEDLYIYEEDYLNSSSDSDSTSTFWNGPIKKEEVEKIVFKNRKRVPDNAIDSWDVSEQQNGSIMAWYLDEDSNGLYELYIGADGGVKANPNSSDLFDSFTKVTSIDLTYLDTSQVTNMSDMFIYCSSLTNITFGENFNTEKVKYMSFMFAGCSSLTTLDLSTFNTEKVTTMNSMFNSCSNLTNIIFGENFNTSEVKYMSEMFYNCSSLTTLDLSTFNTEKVTTMKYMFYNCSSLITLDLSTFNTSEVKYMSEMFWYCSSLTTIDMRSATFKSVTLYDSMFKPSSKLETIYVKDAEAQTFINSRLQENGISNVNVTIAS